MLCGTGARSDRRERILAYARCQATPHDWQRPLADGLQPDLLGQPGNDVGRGDVGPAPIPDDHLGPRIAPMHTGLDRRIDLRDDLGRRAFLATRALSLAAVRGAVREVLRGGNRKHAAQVRHPLEHVLQRFGQPAADFRPRTAKHGMVPFADTLEIGPVAEERLGHGTGFIHVQVDFDSMTPRATDQLLQAFQPPFVSRANSGKVALGANVRSTVCSQMPLTPAAESLSSRPSGYGSNSGWSSGSPYMAK